jgi:hypothetical protein
VRYLSLIIFLFCLFVLGAQFQSALTIWMQEGRSGVYFIGMITPSLIPTIIFGVLTIWLFKRHKK